MLELVVPAECSQSLKPFLIKLAAANERQSYQEGRFFPDRLSLDPNGNVECYFNGERLRVTCPQGDSIVGDVILVSPAKQNAQRLIRRNSYHNTILFTERCDQMCAMCSQPPKDRDFMHLVQHYTDAVVLADHGVRVGISGGEPTLHLDELFRLLFNVASKRKDISFHILSNGQHFTPKHRTDIQTLNESLDILWGIPLYSRSPSLHDEIVGKVGAFEPLMNNLYFLAQSATKIELRTVLVARNVQDLPALSRFIATNLPFIAVWAIMAMEPIGFAKANRETLFFDHSVFPHPLTAAIDYAEARNVNVALYNFPRCTIPANYRRYCTTSISDWKRKYLLECENCTEQKLCTGFFEWYSDMWKWDGVRAI